MTEQHPAPTPGETLAVSITKTLPFGSFVETDDGTVGLVRDLRLGAVGDRAKIRIDEIDDVKHRFSGTPTT